MATGRLHPGEDPETGVRREFEEETGYFPEPMVRLAYYNQFPGILRAAIHLYFATNLTLHLAVLQAFSKGLINI
jgi:8-oxo-dGTP pyrophosphatase MutT (NUDIX family)